MFSNYYNFIPHLPLPSKDSEPLALELMDGYRHDELVEACRMVKERQGLEIDPDSIPVDDPLAFQLLRGECFTYDSKTGSNSYPAVLDRSGIFLLEGMQYAPLLNRLPPMTVEHVAQIISLSRWAFLEAGVVDEFVDVCHGVRPPYLPDARLNPILGETYGFLAYSDQAVQLSELVGGFSPETEEDFFEALKQGNLQRLGDFQKAWLRSAVDNGFDAEVAGGVWSKIELSCGNAISKDLATACAERAMRCAWMKARYPYEFMAAVLNINTIRGSLNVDYVRSCRRSGIPVLPPDVNMSADDFLPTDEGVLCGLKVVHGLYGSRELISTTRDLGGAFTSPQDFIYKLGSKNWHVRWALILVKGGAFDFTGVPRRAMVEFIEASYGSDGSPAAGADLEADWAGLVAEVADKGFEALEWPILEKLAYEKSVLGDFLSGRPAVAYESKLSRVPGWEIDRYLFRGQSMDRVEVRGWLALAHMAQTSDGAKYSTFEVSDETGSIGCVLMGDMLPGEISFVDSVDGSFVVVRGELVCDDFGRFVRVSEIAPIDFNAR